VRGGTWFQTEGGNDRLQDRPRTFIDAAQPTYQLAASQGHLVSRIDLPNGMHSRGTGGRNPLAAATSRGTAETGLAEPATQRATARQRRIGEVLSQDQPDQLGAPIRVLLAEGVGLEHDIGGTLRPGRRVAQGRGLGLALVVASLAEEMVDGSQGQVKALRQGSGREAALVSPQDGATENDWDGAWHDR
jgi:hypothetical protein